MDPIDSHAQAAERLRALATQGIEARRPNERRRGARASRRARAIPRHAHMHFMECLERDVLTAAFTKGMEAVDKAIALVQNLAIRLRPFVLDDFGLEAALTWCAEILSEHPGHQIHLDLQLGDRPLPATLETNCFRLVAGLLARFPEACEICVSVHRQQGHLLIEVDGDGKIDPSDAAPSAAVRTSRLCPPAAQEMSMQDRVELLKGTFEAACPTDEGSRVRIVLPVSWRRVDMAKLRVLLADDHILIRAGLRALIQSIPNAEVVAEANDGVEALELIEKTRPTLALLDITMPRMNGLDTATRIAAEFPTRA